jgi:general secretion pathway protein D
MAGSEGRDESARFDLATPAQANAHDGFTVNLLFSGRKFEKAELDLVLDQPGMQLAKVTPREGTVLEARQDGSIVHLSMSKGGADGSLAMLTFQSDSASGGILNLSLQNLKVESEDHVQIRGAVTLPKQVTLTP